MRCEDDVPSSQADSCFSFFSIKNTQVSSKLFSSPKINLVNLKFFTLLNLCSIKKSKHIWKLS